MLPASGCEGLYSAHENDFLIFILHYVGEEREVRYPRENMRFEILKISHTTTTAIPAIAVAATASRSQAQFETMLYILISLILAYLDAGRCLFGLSHWLSLLYSGII